MKSIKSILCFLSVLIIIGCGKSSSKLLQEQEKVYDVSLSNIELSSGVLSFDSDTLTYFIDMSWWDKNIVITPTTIDETNIITIDSVIVDSGCSSNPINLSIGDNNIVIVVKSSDDVKLSVYNIHFNRLDDVSHNANLSELNLSTGSLSPVFNEDIISYAVEMDNTNTSIVVTPKSVDENSVVKINDIIAPETGQSVNLNVGQNIITVTSTAEDNEVVKTYTITITVYVLVTGVSLNKETVSIGMNTTEQLQASVAPSNAKNKNVTWSTSDSNKVSVSNGLITGVAVGSATITVTTQDGGFTDTCLVSVFTVGEQTTYTADSISFKMIHVPGKTFPTGTNDSGIATVDRDYRIGETVVTYQLWSKVYTWAISNGYTFANVGGMGGYHDGHEYQVYTTGHETHPVTMVNWRDAMVFCNAITEWYNAKNGSSYACVYKNSGIPIRDSQDTNSEICDSVTPDDTANGFRLLTLNEYELAARWRNDSVNIVSGYINPYFTKGNSASGATADCTNATATSLVGVYNSGSTSAVKSKVANSLGLYDMSGNVDSWCFDLYVPYGSRFSRGGLWFLSPNLLQIGFFNWTNPNSVNTLKGFRLAK